MGSAGEEHRAFDGRHEQLLLLLAVDHVRLRVTRNREKNGRRGVADDFGGVEVADVGIDLFDDVADLLVGVERRLLEMQNETVDLVDDENGLHALLEGLLEDGQCLGANPLDHIDNDETTVAQTHLCCERASTSSTAAETSELKSMCPGESTRLMR